MTEFVFLLTILCIWKGEGAGGGVESGERWRELQFQVFGGSDFMLPCPDGTGLAPSRLHPAGRLGFNCQP